MAEERRLARVQALEWSREVKMESGEKREQKSKKMRKVKAENCRGGEAGEQKKKRRGKLRKEGGGDVDQVLFSNDEDERPCVQSLGIKYFPNLAHFRTRGDSKSCSSRVRFECTTSFCSTSPRNQF
jgi:hypothetical protein